jgi:hypothetical protein
MPPRDGDGISIDTGDELVAQIIPLRRRAPEADEPQLYGKEPEGSEDVVDLLQSQSSSAERSVWDQPIVELHRRETPRATWLGVKPGRGILLGKGGLSRGPVLAIVATVAIVSVAVLAIIFANLQGHPGPVGQRTTSSASGVSLMSVNQTIANAKRRALPSRGASVDRGRQLRRLGSEHPRTSLVRSSIGTNHVVPDVAASDTAAAQDSSTTTLSAAAPPRVQPQAEHAPARVTSPSISDANAHPASTEQCVPGELGC